MRISAKKNEKKEQQNSAEITEIPETIEEKTSGTTESPETIEITEK